MILILLILILSCKEKTYPDWTTSISSVDDIFATFSSEIQINGEVYIDDSTQLMKPINLRIVNNILFINDNYNSELFSVYNMKTRKFVGRFLKQGKGPNEYLGGFSLSINPFIGDSLMVFNVINSTLNIFFLDNTCKSAGVPKRRIHLIPGKEREINERCFLFNNVLLTSGMFHQGRFHIYNLKGKDIGFFGKYPKVKCNGKYDNFHLGDKFGSSMNFVFDHNKNRVACTSSKSLTIYSYNKKNGLKISTHFDVQWDVPTFYSATYDKKSRARVVTLGNESDMIGAGFVTANKDYILFPFSNYPKIKIHKEGLEDWFGYIFVMDWDGNPIARLKLDKRIKFPLEIDETGRYVYSIHTDLEETGMRLIVRYDIGFLKDL